MSFVFIPEYKVVTTIEGTHPAEELLEQQGMFGADLSFAYQHAGKVLQNVLDSIPETYHTEAAENGMELNIDVRIHELAVGDYPATPGWHCDAPQRETEFSNKGETVPVANSLVVNLSSNPLGVSNTIFAMDPVELDNDRMDQSTWAEMNALLGDDFSRRHVSQDGQFIQFSCYTPHAIQPAQHDGVRMFVRISQWKKPEGFNPGLAKTEQVYRLVTPIRNL